MTCPFCGKADNPARAKFCSHCGTALLTNHGEPLATVPDPAAASPAASPAAVTPEMFFPWRKPEAAPEARPEPVRAARETEPIVPTPPVEQTRWGEPTASPEATVVAEPIALPPGEPIAIEHVAAASETRPGRDGGLGEAASQASPPPPGGFAGPPPGWAASGPNQAADLATVTRESRYWATGAHASAFVGAWLGGVPAFVGPLIVWLVRRDDDPFAAEHGRNALNFNLSIIVYVVAMVVFSIFTFGIGLLVTIPGFILLGLAWLALTLVGTIKAASSETYRYPLTIRFFR